MACKMIVLLAIMKLTLAMPDPHEGVNIAVNQHVGNEPGEDPKCCHQHGSPDVSQVDNHQNCLSKGSVEDLSFEENDDISRLANVKASTPVTFCIKQWISGKFITPDVSCGGSVSEGDSVVIGSKACDDNTEMAFDIYDGSKWGYIRHVKSTLIFSPKDATNIAPVNARLILTIDRRPWGLFYLDQVNNVIRHISGLAVYSDGLDPYPPDGTPATIYSFDPNTIRTKFTFVNCSNTDEVVAPYGNAAIAGDWRLFFSVDNPMAPQTYTVEVKLGYSTTESTTSTFKFAWEVRANARYLFGTMSTSLELSLEIQRSSSETWTSETTITNHIEVKPQEPVAVWQKVFIGSQAGHRNVFQSDMFAHTNSSRIVPPEFGYTQYQFN